MEDEEEDHEYLQDTYDLLPMATLAAVAHEPVETDSDNAFDIIVEVMAMRKSEDGEGHWTGMIAEFGGNIAGVAQTPGWSSAVVPDASTIAHELGHNLSLRHAPSGAGNPDPLFPDPDEQGELVLKPAFVVDARSAVVPAPGPYPLTGRDGDGRTLFSLSFDMDRLSDLGDAKAFAHLLPVETAWRGALASIELSGPEGEVTVDTETDDPMTILRDPDSGQFRAFLRGVRPDGSFDPNLTALRSRGLPVAAEGR